MNKSQRIQLDSGTTNNDKYIKIQLEQNIDTLEFLSMSLETKDVYQDFNADYGVLIGRVTANGGVGIPNAKISIFIPLTDTDAEIGEIASIYPYKTPRDKNNEGKRYNLLPRVAKIDPITQVTSPKQPFGSFPIKEELVTNIEYLDVYKKYYKYTALTNNAGDYMIFGVPTGTQTVHLSVDITDIGKYSMNPASMVTNLGYSPNLFIDNGARIKPSNDLGDLPNIETQEISVDVIPFWGDTTIFTIGITRQDFRIRAVLNNTFVIFGSAFTDGNNAMWANNVDNVRNVRELYSITEDKNTNVGISSKRIGKVTEKIYYYPISITDDEINAGAATLKDKMNILDSSEYSVYRRDGDFIFIISCNRNKVITDEFGVETPIDDNSPNGIFTTFKGFITIEITSNDVSMDFTKDMGSNVLAYPLRLKIKIPQKADRAYGFDETESIYTTNWRNQYMTFSGGTIYSVAKFHGLVANGNGSTNGTPTNGFIDNDEINKLNSQIYYNTGIIKTTEDNNAYYDFPSNGVTDSSKPAFGANWLNLSLYLPQFGWFRYDYSSFHNMRVTTNVTETFKNSGHAVQDNTQEIAAGVINTKWFARSDLHWTDFIILSKTDILNMNNVNNKGLIKTAVQLTNTTTYRNGERIPSGWSTSCPINGGKINGIPTNINDSNIYFYKGFDTADCVEFIVSLGLV